MLLAVFFNSKSLICFVSLVCVVFFLQESLNVMSTTDDITLGFTLELYSRYMLPRYVKYVLENLYLI